MTLTQETLDELRATNGAESTLGDDSTPPYGYTLVGAVSRLQDIAERMDEYGITYTDLPTDQQNDFDEAHEALQFHIANLSNLLANDMVGQDGSIELPNGNTIDLPKQATSGSKNESIPSAP